MTKKEEARWIMVRLTVGVVACMIATIVGVTIIENVEAKYIGFSCRVVCESPKGERR